MTKLIVGFMVLGAVLIGAPAMATEDSPVLTVLEAHVPKERVAEVKKVFEEGTATIPPGIAAFYLVQDQKDPTLFRLHTVWRTHADFDKVRANVKTKSKAVQLFESLGATTKPFDAFNVVVQGPKTK